MGGGNKRLTVLQANAVLKLFGTPGAFTMALDEDHKVAFRLTQGIWPESDKKKTIAEGIHEFVGEMKQVRPGYQLTIEPTTWDLKMNVIRKHLGEEDIRTSEQVPGAGLVQWYRYDWLEFGEMVVLDKSVTPNLTLIRVRCVDIPVGSPDDAPRNIGRVPNAPKPTTVPKRIESTRPPKERDAERLLDLAKLYLKSKNKGKARESANEVIKLSPDSDMAKEARRLLLDIEALP